MNFHTMIGIITTYFYITTRLHINNQAFGHFVIAIRIAAFINSRLFYLTISNGTGINNGVIILLGTLRINTLMDGARVTQRIMSVTCKYHRLRILVENRIQSLHTPRKIRRSVTFTRPGTITGIFGWNVRKDEDGLTRTFFLGTGQPLLQSILHFLRIGKQAIGLIAIITINSTATTDGDKRITLDDHILIIRIILTTIKRAQAFGIIRQAGNIIVITHHKYFVGNRVNKIIFVGKD